MCPGKRRKILLVLFVFVFLKRHIGETRREKSVQRNKFCLSSYGVSIPDPDSQDLCDSQLSAMRALDAYGIRIRRSKYTAHEIFTLLQIILL